MGSGQNGLRLTQLRVPCRSLEMTPGSVKRRIGTILTRVGATIGMLGVAAMAIRLKALVGPGLQQMLVYKGFFVAAAILLVLGAIYGRQGRDEDAEATSSRPSGSSLSSSDADALPEHYSTSVREIPERQYERRDHGSR